MNRINRDKRVEKRGEFMAKHVYFSRNKNSLDVLRND
jgi:hypothetical protein